MQVNEVLALPDAAAAEVVWKGLDALPPDQLLLLLLEIALADRGEASAAAIRRLDDVVDTSDLKQHFRNEALGRFWSLSRESALSALKKYSKSFGLAAVCSFVYDGFVRERAVGNLGAFPDCRGLPYLLLRTSDWIPAVNQLAAKLVTPMLRAASDERLLEGFSAYMHVAGAICPPERVRVDRFGRRRKIESSHVTGHRSSLAQVVADGYRHELETRPGLMRALRAIVSSAGARWLLKKMCIGVGEDPVVLLQAALASHDPANVGIAVKHVRILSSTDRLELLEPLAMSRVPSARMEAIEIANEFNRVDLLTSAVDDANWRVRNNARFYLEKRGDHIGADHYRALFPNAASVAGFGEVADATELSELLPLIDHKQGAVRIAAINALGQRELSEAIPAITLRLADASSGVVRAATKALRKLRVRLSHSLLESLLEDMSRPAHVRATLQEALDLVPRWDRLILILSLSRSGALSRAPTRVLSAWLSKKSSERALPTPPQIHAATAALAASESSLHPETVKKLREELAYWQRWLKV